MLDRKTWCKPMSHLLKRSTQLANLSVARTRLKLKVQIAILDIFSGNTQPLYRLSLIHI